MAVGTGVLTAAAAVVIGLPTTAAAATVFSDDFNDGDASGWTASGGSWSVVNDGTPVYQQSGTSSDARARTGSASLADYTVTVRVKPTAVNGSNRFVAVLARAQSATSYYYLALRSNNTVELKKLVNGSSTTLASAGTTFTLNNWHTLSLEVSGSTLRGSVNGASMLTVTDTQFASGQVGVATFNASARFDDVGVADGPGPTPTTTGPTTTPTTAPPTTGPPPTTGIVGWATQAGGTTGGASGPTVTVSSWADLRTQAQTSGARTILVNGMFSGSGTIEVTADKTIRGVGANSGVSGTTFNIEDMQPANVIIQNLNIRGVPGGDAIQIENATHIWIDHNTMSSTIEDDVDFYDGMMDMTHAADYITVSWNIVRDHWKTSLVGHSDGNASEDDGHLRITYHHNWFDRTFERSPRVRFGETVHVFNNYYTNINNNTASYAIASTMDAGVLVEGNVFENVQQACWSASGYADSDPGRLVARDNSLTSSGPCETNGTVAAVPYSYTAESVNTVKATVGSGAGTGRI
ncbi:pectate lyase [Catenuloplanes nepalensis]|uniref:Pectate lyase n=1 Tax=Catenuloplanes nepalensis TaxID=587533 RepID=A0ABT9MR14_9ACTN|nr:family 16 glycoside hydrolase [Catenuloplanes nepalensis]MDP9793834.1 pectate lyase [Catenuloplanes nepalensis]